MTAASESINTKRGVRNPRNLGRTLSSPLSSRFEILFKFRKGLTKNGSTVFYMLKGDPGTEHGTEVQLCFIRHWTSTKLKLDRNECGLSDATTLLATGRASAFVGPCPLLAITLP
jgi:hypothetical protein